jgi:hypothetical protein
MGSRWGLGAVRSMLTKCLLVLGFAHSPGSLFVVPESFESVVRPLNVDRDGIITRTTILM